MVQAGPTSYLAADGTPVDTYLARPEAPGPMPALVLAYEFWGMLETPPGGPHMRELAQRFAAQGFVAAVPDFYAARGQQPTMVNGTVVGTPSDEKSTSDLCDAVRWLGSLPFVDPRRIGAIGWCGGGRQALFLAAHCEGVRAAATFYGRLINRPSQPGPSPMDLISDFRCPIFGAYGEEDPSIPVDSARQFSAALTAANKDHEMHIFAGAKHAFMNDEYPEGYDRTAASESWNRVIGFFETNLRGAGSGGRSLG